MTLDRNWTEEDVKAKVILPFLLALGFKPSDIECEVHVEIRLGRTVLRTDNNKETEGARGRIDFTVSLPDDPNLILIEAKSDKSDITEKDIAQGLSYAKAVDPFPPLTMVTNGKKWRIFNSRTCKEITEEEVDGYDVGLEDAERYYKAIRRLRSLSKKNLDTFCKWQVLEHMEPLLGSRSDKAKKYIPEWFHEPEELSRKFDGFLQSDSEVFVLTGRSGDGKSCWMCDRALELLRSGWNVFFFRGLDARKGLAKTLADEIQSQIGPSYSPIDAMRRISEITSRGVVFIDGLDEISPDAAREITTDFLRLSASSKLRLVASCKSTQWSQLREFDDIPIALWERSNKSGYFYELQTQWSPADLDLLIKKYQKFYGCSARLGPRAYQAVRGSPYLLRILFEEGEGKDEDSMLSTDSRRLYEILLSNARSRLSGRVPNLEEILTAIAKAMIDDDVESLEESSARSALDLGLTDELPSALFEASILERDYLDDNPPRIRFYFNRMRDFLVGFRVLRWHKMKPDQLKESADSIDSSTVLKEALELFYSIAEEEQKRVLDETVYRYSCEYLTAYEHTLNTDFPRLKERIVYDWENDAELGFVGEITFNPLSLRMEGVQVKKIGEPTILLIPRNSDLRHNYNAAMGGFWSKDDGCTGDEGKAEHYATLSIWSGIQKLIENFHLDESGSLSLLKERVLAFHSDKYTSVLTRVPLNVSASRWQILFDKAMRNKRHLLFKQREESGQCKISWSGTSRNVSLEPTSHQEQQAMIDFSSEMADSGQIVQTKGYLTRDEDRILFCLSVLDSNGADSLVDEPLFEWYLKPFSEQTHEDLIRVVQWLVENLVPTYESFVKLNFPNHWERFPSIVQPKRIVLFIEGQGPEAILRRWEFRSNQAKSTLELVEDISALPTELPYPPNLLKTGSHDVLPRRYRSSSWSDELNYSFCIFHKLIYDQLLDDLKKAVPEFARLHSFSHNTDNWL